MKAVDVVVLSDLRVHLLHMFPGNPDKVTTVVEVATAAYGESSAKPGAVEGKRAIGIEISEDVARFRRTADAIADAESEVRRLALGLGREGNVAWEATKFLETQREALDEAFHDLVRSEGEVQPL